MIVILQALSGTDPMRPPDLQPQIVDDGMSLLLHMPITPTLLCTEKMVSKNVSWMSSNSSEQYHSKKQTRLGGLGPAIAQVKCYSKTTVPTVQWKIPLVEPCDEIIGNYSINNFPAERNDYGHQFFPVLMEFKLSTVEQNVKKESRVNSGLWVDDEDGSN